MKIHLSSVAQLEMPGFRKKGEIDIPEGTSIKGFLDLAEIRKEHQSFIVPMVNNIKVTSRYILKEGDSLFLLLPVGGG